MTREAGVNTAVIASAFILSLSKDGAWQSKKSEMRALHWIAALALLARNDIKDRAVVRNSSDKILLPPHPALRATFSHEGRRKEAAW